MLLVFCLPLSNPSNGMISCMLGDDAVPHPDDTCTVTCNNGYQLMGNGTRICGDDGIWSGSDAMCISE